MRWDLALPHATSELIALRDLADAVRSWADPAANDEDGARTDAVYDALATVECHDPKEIDMPPPRYGLEYLAPVAEEMAEKISAYYPSPDHVLAQTPPREVADSLLMIVYRAILEHGAFAQLERMRDQAEAVRALHERQFRDLGQAQVCSSCGSDIVPVPWPCPTVQALDTTATEREDRYDLVFVAGDRHVVYHTFADRDAAEAAAARLRTSGASMVVLPHGTAATHEEAR